MLILPATLTAKEARDTRAMLTQALRQGAKKAGDSLLVSVDASALTRFDSSALSVLLECQRLAQSCGKRLVVEQAPDKLVDLARLYGVDELLMVGAAAA
jgi:phospholipid transport system transporter-binding protein